jgi:hypothetical protein
MCKVKVECCNKHGENEDLFNSVRDGLIIMLYPIKFLKRELNDTLKVMH